MSLDAIEMVANYFIDHDVPPTRMSLFSTVVYVPSL